MLRINPITFEEFQERGAAPTFWPKFWDLMIGRCEEDLRQLRLVKRLLERDPTMAADQIVEAARLVAKRPDLITGAGKQSEGVQPCDEPAALPKESEPTHAPSVEDEQKL